MLYDVSRRPILGYRAAMGKTTNNGKSTGSKRSERDPQTGTFIIGREGFTRISAVEGIKPSKEIIRDLDRTERLPSAQRRAELYGKYGKK